MTGPGISDDDELTPEGLSRDKSDLLSEHGLGDTAIGRAAEKIEEQEKREADKRARLVEKKVLLASAEQQGLGDDPDVEALRADVHDMSAELEAEALRQSHEGELEEARTKIDNLEGLAQRADSQNQDRLARNYRQRAAALKAEFPDLQDPEPEKFSAEALGLNESDEEAKKEKEAAEALKQFRQKQAQKEADEELPDEAARLLSNLRNMREQAKQQGHKDLVERYTDRMNDLRAEYSE